jgi:hypothetical protein
MKVPMPEPQIATPGKYIYKYLVLISTNTKVAKNKSARPVGRTCDEGPPPVEVLRDAVQPGEVDYAQAQPCQKD